MSTYKSIMMLMAMLLFFSLGFAASTQDSGHWASYGLKTSLNGKTAFSSLAEFRFQENFSDFSYFKWETGLAYKLNSRVSVAGYYRLNPSEKNGDWSTAHYMLLDQNLNLFSVANWSAAYRNRFHLRLGELGRGFWRPRLQLAYKFQFKSKPASWFVDDEPWYQISDINGRDRFNVNWLTSGFKLNLARNVQFSPFYRLRSDKVTSSGRWEHLHVLGTSVDFVF